MTSQSREGVPIRSPFVSGALDTLPLGVSVMSYGLVFGMLARQAALNTYEALFMSSFVFAGASQMIALGMWDATVTAVVVTTLVVNLRHILMGAAISPYMRDVPTWQRYATVFFMTDESWAITLGRFTDGHRQPTYFLGSGLMLFACWQVSTVAGHRLGSVIPDPAAWGLDFAFVAVFIAIFAGLARKKRNITGWVVAAVTAVIAERYLPGSWYIIVGALAGFAAGGVVHARK